MTPRTIFTFLLAASLTWSIDVAHAASTYLLSRNPDGGPETGHGPSISANGRYVAFYSWSRDLVRDANNTEEQADLYLYDRVAGTTARVSVGYDGTAANGPSLGRPALNGNGRYIAFSSEASNLVPNDTNESDDVFVRDRLNGTTERVSVGADGEEANGWSEGASISADGRYVVFQSGASNLVPGDTNGFNDIFVHDRKERRTTRVSVDSAGNQANGDSSEGVISGNGRFVLFGSRASNLVPHHDKDEQESWDLYVHDLVKGTTELALGGAAPGSIAGTISDDGRYIAFTSSASGLVQGDTNNQSDVFVYDRRAKAFERVSVSTAGVQGNDESFGGLLSGNGRYVGFLSFATNLVGLAAGPRLDMYLHDRERRTTERVSVNSDGVPANDATLGAAVSRNGLSIVFESHASNLAPGTADEPSGSDGRVYMRDRR
jgi:Tol biopolymer transport system component